MVPSWHSRDCFAQRLTKKGNLSSSGIRRVYASMGSGRCASTSYGVLSGLYEVERDECGPDLNIKPGLYTGPKVDWIRARDRE